MVKPKGELVKSFYRTQKKETVTKKKKTIIDEVVQRPSRPSSSNLLGKTEMTFLNGILKLAWEYNDSIAPENSEWIPLLKKQGYIRVKNGLRAEYEHKYRLMSVWTNFTTKRL